MVRISLSFDLLDEGFAHELPRHHGQDYHAVAELVDEVHELLVIVGYLATDITH